MSTGVSTKNTQTYWLHAGHFPSVTHIKLQKTCISLIVLLLIHYLIFCHIRVDIIPVLAQEHAGKMVFFNLANPCNSEWGGQPTPQPLFCARLPPSPPSNSYLWCTKSIPLPQSILYLPQQCTSKYIFKTFMCATGGCARSCLQQSGVAALIVTPKWPQIKNKWDVVRILSDWCLLTNIND